MDSLRDNRLKNAATAGALSVAVFIAITLATSGQSLAQTSSYQSATDNVVINWDALDGGSRAAPMRGNAYGSAQQNAVMPTAPGGLLMPGTSVPGSQLYVAPPSGSGTVHLQQPAPSPKPAPAAMAEKTPPAPAPAKMPTPAPAAVVAKAPPPTEVAPSAPKQLTETKAPAPAKSAAPASAPDAPPVPPAPQIATSSSAPAPAKAETKTASAPAPATPAAPEQASTPPADGPVQIVFNGDDTKLTGDAQAALAQALIVLTRSEKTRVQLMAYAFGDDQTSSKARRISLSRALSVRSYLIEKGVRSTRIDVRALGDKAPDEPKNRVDVNFIER